MGLTAYEYNALNQLDRKVLPGSKIVDYDYDAEGNNTVVADPDNNATNYTYDVLNILSGMQDISTMTRREMMEPEPCTTCTTVTGTRLS